jgi:two-component system CheB/CheR fusion protein
LVHDHVNLVEAARIAAALFGSDLRLRRVTPVAAEALRITPADIGRPLAELSIGLLGCDLPRLVAETIGEQSVRYVEVHNDAAQRFALTIRPYRAVDGQTEGAVLTLVDVTLLRGAEAALAAAEQQISALEKNAFMRGGSN